MAHVLVVVGLAFEERIAAGAGIRVICGGGRATLGAELAAAIDDDCRGLFSFGVAGGLAPALEPGACVIASSVHATDMQWPVQPAWRDALLRKIPSAICDHIAGTDLPVVDVCAKNALHQRAGAATVDMESHVVAEIAARHRLPMAAIRVVTDPADRAVPQAALAGMRSDGHTDVMAVIRALLNDPGELPALLRTARDAYAARRTLLRGREMLGPGFDLPDFR